MTRPSTIPVPTLPTWERHNALRVRCKAWTNYPVGLELVHVRTDGTVCVYDSVAGYFTSVHSLTTEAQARLAARYRLHVAKLLEERASRRARQTDPRQTL